jgi:hypothetical protein
LRDEPLSANLSEVAQNLSITSGSPDRLGLWGIPLKQKLPKDAPPPKPPSSPNESNY